MSALLGPAVRIEKAEDVAVLVIDHPPVNALAAPVRAALAERLDTALDDPATRAVVIVGARDRFIAGADIREFGKPRAPPLIADIQRRMERATKPIVCAIDGYALGGGLELALAAHFRVAARDARFGLPEVTLGLIPAAGGSQRLTRLAGPALALDLILSGRRIDADEAARIGLVDAVVDGDVREAAVALARVKAAQGGPWPGPTTPAAHAAAFDPELFDQVRARNARKWTGMAAPFKIVDCVEAATRLPLEDGLAFELAAFEQCQAAPARAALIHLFFAERAAARIEGFDPTVRPMAIRTVAVVGAGTMGGGIAMALADAGVAVRLLDGSVEALAAGLARIDRNYAVSVERGSKTTAAASEARARILPVEGYDALEDADLVIEAVFEAMDVKREVFKRIDAVARPGALLATNTSALDIDEIASAVARPKDVVGLHFFSPANVMKLVEVVRGALSSETAVATAMAFVKAIGKTAVLAGNREGFIGNRILKRYGAEADALLLQGATPWQVDAALERFGFAMGIYRVRDMTGLDVAQRMRANRIAAAGPGSPAEAMPLADRLCEAGRFGQKTGAGYYLYDGRTPRPDPAVEAMLEAISAETGVVRRAIDDDTIVARMTAAMASEGVAVLGEGVAQRASDIDVAMVLGYGFPRFRGGPMFWAGREGGRGPEDG